MTWTFFEIGYVFYFQKECLGGVERDRLNRTLKKLDEVDTPLNYEGLYSTCPKQERLIIKIIDSDLLLGLIFHKDDDPKYPHSLELVKIINPKEINF